VRALSEGKGWEFGQFVSGSVANQFAALVVGS